MEDLSATLCIESERDPIARFFGGGTCAFTKVGIFTVSTLGLVVLG